MSSVPKNASVLVTGGTGFLGRHIVEELRKEYRAVAFDVVNPANDPDVRVGSVTDAAEIARALEGMSGLVISHMAPRTPGMYESPGLPFDINVKGTALLMDAAVRAGIRRVVLVSSVGAVQGAQKRGEYLQAGLPTSPLGIYALTKSLQEETVRAYHREHGIGVSILRPAYICLGDSLTDKYGVQRPSVNWQFIDPRDIGQAARLSLALPELGCEVFHMVAGPGAEARADIQRAMDVLGWQPRYRFQEFPEDAPRG